jgi:glycosyltransferase involved in cell wall biosynthesis
VVRLPADSVDMTRDARLTGSIAVLHDMVEEGWPSMDQMGHLLTTRVPALAPGLSVTPVHHRMIRMMSPVALGRVGPLFLADRILNRMVLYPRRVRRAVSGRFDIYHVVDHSYAQLALALPPQCTIVSCHDIDTFRSLVQAEEDPRGPLFNAMTRRILAGLRRAAIVVCGSAAAHDDLVRFDLVDPARLRVVPNGIDPALLEPPPAAARSRAAGLLPAERGVADVLHVGNDIPRKRLDRLVDIVVRLRKRGHRIRLVRVGSPLRPETRQRMAALAFTDIVELPFIERDVLRAIYARCNLLLLTSDREGYGLPVLEAFAAGKPVVASDLPALRESSGGLATLVPADSLDEWVDAIERVLGSEDPGGALAAERRVHAAARTWDDHVRGLLPVYEELLNSEPPTSNSQGKPFEQWGERPRPTPVEDLSPRSPGRLPLEVGSWELGVVGDAPL